MRSGSGRSGPEAVRNDGPSLLIKDRRSQRSDPTADQRHDRHLRPVTGAECAGGLAIMRYRPGAPRAACCDCLRQSSIRRAAAPGRLRRDDGPRASGLNGGLRGLPPPPLHHGSDQQASAARPCPASRTKREATPIVVCVRISPRSPATLVVLGSLRRVSTPHLLRRAATRDSGGAASRARVAARAERGPHRGSSAVPCRS
jgi:hypothetical protein